MSSTTLFRISGISLVLGAVLSVIAGLMTLLFDSSLTASPSTIQNPLWSAYWSLIFIVLALILLGLPGLFLYRAGGQGTLLRLIGVLLIGVGNIVGIAMVAYFVSILPLLAARAPRTTCYQTSLHSWSRSRARDYKWESKR